MSEPDDEKLLRKFRILVAPLDWGLGHATRCIPIINELLAHNCEVWIAGEKVQESLLRSEFPDLPFLPLKGYRVEYSKSRKGLRWKMFRQIPKIISSIRAEHLWLKEMVATHSFDAVISDNRFGLYHQKIPSIFITHQLSIKTGMGGLMEKLVQRWNYKHINRFAECWVPDLPGENNLAGELSHPIAKPPVSVRYVGLLSRFDREATTSFVLPSSDEGNNHLLFILSGPEPQRSILENKIVDEVSHYPYTATIIRGLPLSLSVIPSSVMIKFYNHLGAMELSEEIMKAEWIISRCGYSTVMDLIKMQKKSILIPTPGQTEQEYLGRYLKQKQIAFAINQEDFSIDFALTQASAFDYNMAAVKAESLLKGAVEALLNRLTRMSTTHNRTPTQDKY